LDTSLRQVKAWRATTPGLSVSVNLSAVSLLKHGLARRVGEALDRAGLDPSALRLELTETTMMAEMGKKALGEISELGVALSIDDFGTGYSSLSRLRGLPFDEVKIDRSFVSQMCQASDDQAVVRSVIELARGLGKVATAEGVEDRATLERLTALGCHGAQGYYLARPLPAAECEAVLRAGPAGPRVVAGPGLTPF
jgi:EAL domain-containing protein (putative c-di-GMP-specific phosphodiesterase class I)